MKKRWIVLGIILVMVIIVFGFLMERNKQEIDSVSGVTIEIKEGTLTPTGATIIITDTTDKNNSYGEAYRIDKKEDGKWTEVSRVIDNAFFNDIAYLLDDNNQIVREVDWEWIYGRSLPFSFSCQGQFAWGNLQMKLNVEDGLIQTAQVYSDAMDWEIPPRIEQALQGCRFTMDALQRQLEEELGQGALLTDLCQLLSDQGI